MTWIIWWSAYWSPSLSVMVTILNRRTLIFIVNPTNYDIDPRLAAILSWWNKDSDQNSRDQLRSCLKPANRDSLRLFVGQVRRPIRSVSVSNSIKSAEWFGGLPVFDLLVLGWTRARTSQELTPMWRSMTSSNYWKEAESLIEGSLKYSPICVETGTNSSNSSSWQICTVAG